MPSRTARRTLRSLAPGEHEQVLAALLARHPDLRDEAEQLARELLVTVDRGEVASRVVERYLGQSFMEIGDRAGRRPGRGYVHEADAQLELLHEALEPFEEEVRRLARLGFVEPAQGHALGVLDGLDRLCQVAGESTLIGWGALEENATDLAYGMVLTCREADLGLDPQRHPERWQDLG